jgi:hypothetical protein
MLIQGQVGLQALQDGSQVNLSIGRQGEALVSELHGRYYQLAKRGLLFGFSTAAVTIAATHNSPLPANTGTPILALWNPVASGKDLVVLKHSIASVSGTPGGPMVWNWGTVTATAAALSTVVSGRMGQSPAGSIANVYSNVVTTSSLAGALHFHAAGISAVAATGQGGANAPAYEDRGGDIIIPPGSWGALCSTATGTSHVVQASVIWAELVI